MADTHDFYQLLGVSRTATEDEIKRAYRQLARKYHPDVNREADAETRFKEITEAYQVLGDSQKRQMYDRFGHAGIKAGSARGGAGTEGFPFGDIGDLFESFFGAATTRRGPQRGSDLRMGLRLTFQEAVFGVEKELVVPRWESCLICGGSGAQPGKPPVRCPKCGGSGDIRRVQQSVFGQFVNVMPCDRCRGEGQILEQKCQECGGAGRLKRTRTLTVTIPAGVDDGAEMRLSNEGEGGERGGPNGNLHIQLDVEDHPTFQRDGFDLVYELPLNIAQASLGGEVRVPTLDGEDDLRVPPGTQHGRTFRLKEKGVPRLQRSGRGDLRVVARVEVPQQLTGRQRELLAALARTFGESGAGTDAAGDLEQQPVDAQTRDGAGAAPVRRSRGKKDKGKGILNKMKDALGLDDE